MKSGLPTPDAALFDLDGTLVDNFTAIHVCCAEVAKELGFPEMSYDTVKSAVGGSIAVTMRRLLPPEIGDRAVALYRQKFARRMFEGLYVYEGVEDILKTLRARGVKLAVFTNKDIGATRLILDHTGLTGYFDAVIGTGDTPWRKPDAAFTAHALATLGAKAETTVMIGDSPFDIAAARNGGLRAVYCVTTGSHDAAQLAEHAPDGVHAGMDALSASVFP